MIKLISTAVITSLLVACSGMSGSGSISTSKGTPSTASMGAQGALQQLGGPRGSSGE